MFDIKDTGTQQVFESGMVRDAAVGKDDPTLALDGPMFVRWYTHLSKAARVKYPKRNWMKANGEAELERFKISAVRHFLQWLDGDQDEDHAAAVFFNINGVEYVKSNTPRRPSNVGADAKTTKPHDSGAFDGNQQGQDDRIFLRKALDRSNGSSGSSRQPSKHNYLGSIPPTHPMVDSGKATVDQGSGKGTIHENPEVIRRWEAACRRSN